MQSNMLDSEEVVAARSVLRDGDADGSLVCEAVSTCSLLGTLLQSLLWMSRTQASPRQLTSRARSLLSVDLEPHLSASVPGIERLTARHFRQVELQRSRVEDVRAVLKTYT